MSSRDRKMAVYSTCVYKGRNISLFKERKLLPNGCYASMDVVRHPGAVLIIPFLDAFRIVFIRQYRPVIESTLYELPAGTINKGESPLVCARREVIEETGYSAKKMILLGSIYPVPGYATEKIFIYKASQLSAQFLPADDDEIIERCVMKKNQVKRLLKQGRLKDAKTIAALVLCGWM